MIMVIWFSCILFGKAEITGKTVMQNNNALTKLLQERQRNLKRIIDRVRGRAKMQEKERYSWVNR